MNKDGLKLTITQTWNFNNHAQKGEQIKKSFSCQEDLDDYLTDFKGNLFLQNTAFQWKANHIFSLTVQYEVNQQLISSQTINILQLELLDKLTELEIQKDESFSVDQKEKIESEQAELIHQLKEISSQSDFQLFGQSY